MWDDLGETFAALGPFSPWGKGWRLELRGPEGLGPGHRGLRKSGRVSPVLVPLRDGGSGRK